jgi:hypothetical protein
LDEPIQNPLIRSLKDKLGHGGFMCALTEFEGAEFSCQVPWKKLEIKMITLTRGTARLRVDIKISCDLFLYEDGRFNRRIGSNRAYVSYRRADIPLCDPAFNPEKLTDDLVELIKVIKEGYKNCRKLKLTKFPNSCVEKINAIWSEIGRTENA